jgi:predicted DNA-binding protein (MmcQ/YjbR family)
MPGAYAHPRGAKYAAWRAYLLSKPGAEERHPFDPGLPVYFVKGKMFAIFSQEAAASWMNLKCIPDWSLELRREYKAIEPGYHMNKRHWNTVLLDGSVPRGLLKKLVDCSYDLVSGRMKLALKKEGAMLKPKGKIR